MRKNQNQKFRFDSPVESPVSVEGKSPCAGRSPQRARLLTLRQKVLIMVTDFLLGLQKLMHEEEGGKTYLLPEFVPARSELNSNLELLDKPCRQTKYNHFLFYRD
jgi:hypothetical protein